MAASPSFALLDRPHSERPCLIGRQPFGRTHISNSDADGHAYTNIAMDQGDRAVSEIVTNESVPQPLDVVSSTLQGYSNVLSVSVGSAWPINSAAEGTIWLFRKEYSAMR